MGSMWRDIRSLKEMRALVEGNKVVEILRSVFKKSSLSRRFTAEFTVYAFPFCFRYSRESRMSTFTWGMPLWVTPRLCGEISDPEIVPLVL